MFFSDEWGTPLWFGVTATELEGNPLKEFDTFHLENETSRSKPELDLLMLLLYLLLSLQVLEGP